MTRQEYIFIIKNDRQKSYDGVGWLALALNAAAFTVLFFNAIEKNIRNWSAAGAIIILVYAVLILVLQKRFPRSKKLITVPLLFAAISWFAMAQYIPAVASILLFLLEYLAKKQTVVTINSNSVIFDGFPKRTMHWNELENIVLRNELLTLDLKNNRLIQVEISQPVLPETEATFNSFCSKHLEKARI